MQCGLLFIKAADGVPERHFQVQLVPHQITDIINAVLDHCGALGAEPPCNDLDVGGKAERQEHFRPENTAVANLHVLVEPCLSYRYRHAKRKSPLTALCRGYKRA